MMAAISGVSRSATNAVTTAPNAAPMTTATARSTTLPRRMKALKSLTVSFTVGPPGASFQGRPYLGPLWEVPGGIRRNTRGRTGPIGGLTVRGRRGRWAALLLAGVSGVAALGQMLLTEQPAFAFAQKVELVNFAYQPATANIKPGDKIIWFNTTNTK